MVERQATDCKSPASQKSRGQLRKPSQSDGVLVVVTGADVGMDESCITADESGRSLSDLTEYEVAFRRDRTGMCGQSAIKGDDASSWQFFTQMIERAAIAEAQLHHGPIHRRDLCADVIQDVALSRQPTNETVKPAHR